MTRGNLASLLAGLFTGVGLNAVIVQLLRLFDGNPCTAVNLDIALAGCTVAAGCITSIVIRQRRLSAEIRDLEVMEREAVQRYLDSRREGLTS